jgi:hypothetical protein
MIRQILLMAALWVGLVAVLALPYPVAATSASETVSFNVESLKFHCPTCIWAQRCTKNCVTTTRADALKRGGVPCKVCGGACG